MFIRLFSFITVDLDKPKFEAGPLLDEWVWRNEKKKNTERKLKQAQNYLVLNLNNLICPWA